MFLKRISLSGFKSFADRVDFDFGPGVTCIVGPNGCGKSNILDAFKWVLGEQSARSLRGRQMLDMIFNGSSSRRSSGMSQVDLTFDNGDHGLPLDREEVTVSRRLYRSGESEYLLNLESTRLKDIRELFMGTGVGTHAYSTIEQGKVDALLQANPVERRYIFEEAAGISRYKLRRREAQRRLERTEQNLLRIEDIVQEVDKRLRSVKLQAGKARNFQTYDRRLKELRSTHSLAEFHRLSRQWGEAQTEVDASTDLSTQLRSRLGRFDAESSEVSLAIEKLTENITSCDHQVVRVQGEITGIEDRLESSRRRISELGDAEVRAQERGQAQAGRVEELRRVILTLDEENTGLLSRIEDCRARIDRLHSEDQALSLDLTRAQALLEDEKAGIVDLLRQTARLHNEISSLDRHRSSLVDHKNRLSERDAVIGSELEGAMRQRALLEARMTEIDQLIAAETSRLEERKTAAAHVENTRLRLAEELAAAKELRSGLLSRQSLLLDLERKMEGVGAGVRRLLESKLADPDSRPLHCVKGMVADVMHAEIVHALIIEAAIKEFDQVLVVSDSGEFLSDPTLFDDLPGRLTAVCLDRLPPIVNERDFSDEPGFVARAIDFVKVPDGFDQLARWLLAKTIIVQTLDEALTLSTGDVLGYRFVTLSGQLVEPNGCISMGPPATLAGLISRRSELRDIDVQLEELKGRMETLEGRLNRTSAEATHLQQVQQELRTAIYESHTARVESNASLQSVSETIRRLTAERPLVSGEVELLARQIADSLERASQSQKSLDGIQQENARRESQLEAHKDRIDRLVAQRAELQEAQTQARIEEGQFQTRRAAALNSLETGRRDLREAEESLTAVQTEIELCRHRIEDSETSVLSGREKLNELNWEAMRLEAQSLNLRRRRELLRVESEESAARSKEDRSLLEQTEARLHELQLVVNEARVRRDELCSRVSSDLGIDLHQQHETYRHEDQDWAAVETEIEELRGRIERLGNVNLDAIAEQEELERRAIHLTRQRDDLHDARRQLLQLIEKLDAECRERFDAQFALIRGHFQELFRKLFGGGKADIVLENPEDPLESGIEIVARPPGKELQSITLMSGGEKTMTAIALLMSIFRAQPAPFAILDEVDAALDEANNTRFNSIIREFLDRSQFIVITHSKRTMTIADQLYGITMQEPGVSTRVSVRFDQQNEPRPEAAVA